MSQFQRISILEAGANYLASDAAKAKLDAQFAADIAAGKKQYKTMEYFHRKKLAGFTGTINLIESTDDRAFGVTSLDKGKLPIGTVMALLGVQLNYGYNATATTVTSQRYANTDFVQAIPAKLENAEFRLKYGDDIILNCRASKFFGKTSTTSFGISANFDNVVLLAVPELLQDKQMITAELQFSSESVADPSNNHFIEIVLVGVIAKDRTNA